MNNLTRTIIVKIISSLPVIFIALYYVPFIGICLIILRYLSRNYYSRRYIPIWLLAGGFGIYLPLILKEGCNILKKDITTITYLNDILNNEFYNQKLVGYGKLLLIVGLVFLILAYLFRRMTRNLSRMLNGSMMSYMSKSDAKDREIAEKNDLIMREKREKAKDTHVVKCPHCGATITLTGPHGICVFCRREL